MTTRQSIYRAIHRVLRRVQIRPGEDVFLDYGSGMGRAVVVAATYPFRKVIGIELSPELNDVARDNIKRARAKLVCNDIELITMDARHYVVPPDATVVLLFNPFEGSLLTRVFPKSRRVVGDVPKKNEPDCTCLPWVPLSASWTDASGL